MARKSRKNKNTGQQEIKLSTAVLQEVKQMATAAYVRLSVDKGDDDSIENQIGQIHQYIDADRELRLQDTYIDNGYTGTNFDRPDFIRLMEDVKKGKIQCIVVKDLSRFGRNFLETGYYIETVFPHLNVRFISINDDFDSSREADRNNIAVPVKNMVNEYYAKDFSKKQTALFELHSQRGDAKILRSIYGYSLDRAHNQLVPNPETAPVVRLIFRWFLLGSGTTEIARQLNTLGVMTPLRYKQTFEENKSTPENDCWRPDRVKTILMNQSYIGDTVYGKRRKILYRNMPAYHTKPEEWIIHKGTHEPLVLQEDYEKVRQHFQSTNQFRKERRQALKENREKFHDSFPQKVRCAECGNTMTYGRYSFAQYKVELNGAEYTCDGDDRKPGCKKKVNEDYLRIVVMEQIQVLITAVCSRKELLQKVKGGTSGKGALISAENKIQHLMYRLSKSEETRATLYENKVEGIIDEDEYRYMKEHYILEKQELEKKIRDAEESKRQLVLQLNHMLDFEEHLEQYIGNSSFNEELVEELVDYIEIGKDGDVHICFKCEDVFQQMMELTESEDAQ